MREPHPPVVGIVESWDDGEGWGVLRTPDGLSVFCHFSSVEVEGYRSLLPGAAVWFDYETPGQDGCDARVATAARPGAPSQGDPDLGHLLPHVPDFPRSAHHSELRIEALGPWAPPKATERLKDTAQVESPALSQPRIREQQRGWGLGAAARGMMLFDVDLGIDQETRPSRRLMALVITGIIASTAIGTGLAAGLTWRSTHDGGWAAFAGVCGYLGSTVLAALVGSAIDKRRAKSD